MNPYKMVVAVANQKGCCAKTTTAVNLAAALAKCSKNHNVPPAKVLLIDLDPQGNATTGFGKNNNDEDNNVYNLLIKKINLKEAIQKTKINNLEIIGSHVNLSGLEVETASDAKRAFVLKEILSEEKKKTGCAAKTWPLPAPSACTWAFIY